MGHRAHGLFGMKTDLTGNDMDFEQEVHTQNYAFICTNSLFIFTRKVHDLTIKF